MLSVVGKPIPPIDGPQRATGAAQFVSDIRLPGMLCGKVLRSPYPHARILSIDTSKAKCLPGVKAVLTYQDAPSEKFGPTVNDWYMLAKDKVRFIGEEVVAVAAVDEDIAEEALQLVKVEYEELPAVFDPEEAMKPGAPLINEERQNNIVSHFHVERGNVDEAFAKADYIYEDVYRTSQVYQAYLEPVACVAEPDLNGRLKLYLPIQTPSKTRLNYARALGISPDSIRIIKPYVGGGFGAKMDSNLHLICALLALKTGRPVKMVNTREEDFIAGNPRVPMVIYLRIAFSRDGLFLGKDVRVIAGNGGRTVYSPAVMSTACYRIDSLYKFGSVRANGYSVYTNTVPTGCFRGLGNAQMTFAVESAIDMAAASLGIDPAEIRLKNAYKPGDTSIHGWKLLSYGLTDCIKEVTRASDWEQKRRASPVVNGLKRRGIGLACCNHVSGNRAFFEHFDGASAWISLKLDGTVTVFHGEADIGQGQNTVFAQIAAEVLNVPIERVQVAETDTDLCPFGLGSFATRGTLFGGNAVKAAAIDLGNKILDTAGELLEVPKDALDIKDGCVVRKDLPSKSVSISEVARYFTYHHGGSSLTGSGFWTPDTVIPDPETKYGNVSPAYPFAAHVAEVEVDEETGEITLVNYWACHDVGKVVNPLLLEGQVHGGVSMGAGWALMEEMVLKGGKVINPSFLDYRVPGSEDLPKINTLFVETNDPNGPFGAKGIGEPALNPVVPAIANAIYNATGIRVKELPISAEKLLFLLKERFAQLHGR